MPRRTRAATFTLAITAAVLLTPVPLAIAASSGRAIPTAQRFSGVPTVGALFSGTGRKEHFCTASVVDSTAGDLLITAAHCVYTRSHGYVKRIVFVPGYHNGKRPYGTWTVKKITVASGWRRSQNPDLDVAFLTVGADIQARTGGLRLGIDRGYNQAIVPIGYNDTANEPVKCRTHSVKFRARQLKFYCHDFWDGTSGGPWITGFNPRTGTGTVTGLIGGYEQGGNYEWSSYSPYFSSAVAALFRRATVSGSSARVSAQVKRRRATDPETELAKSPAKDASPAPSGGSSLAGSSLAGLSGGSSGGSSSGGFLGGLSGGLSGGSSGGSHAGTARTRTLSFGVAWRRSQDALASRLARLHRHR